MFATVRQSKAPQQIIHQIRSAILEGKLNPGDRLASETELMEEFGVSKATLRESLRALEYLGLVEMRKGATGGAFVAEVEVEIARESLINFFHFKHVSTDHLSEIRKCLEPYAARVAAKTISDEDLEKLNGLLERCRRAMSEGNSSELRRNEIKFHRMIANATQNPILILILDFVDNLLEDVKRVLKPGTEFSRSVIGSHERIYDALRDRDPDKASREMLADVSMVAEGLNSLSKKRKTQ